MGGPGEKQAGVREGGLLPLRPGRFAMRVFVLFVVVMTLGLAFAPVAQAQPNGATPPPPPPPGEPIPWTSVLAGLGFIFGISAFITVLKLRAEVRRHASRH